MHLDVAARWQETLEALERDPMELADRVDWVAKYRLIDAYRQRHGLTWDDDRLRALDLQYHDLRPERSLARRVGLATLVDDDEVARAVTDAPEDTRAWFRGACLRRFGDRIVAANWDSMVFDLGGSALRRVPMMEPLRGTRESLGSLMDAATTAGDLLDALGR
ncbi:MAG: proteasome accessory factor PafA2 family protein [Microthrixaceae bacterium]